MFANFPIFLEATIHTIENKSTEQRAWRSRDFDREFPCGESYRRELEKDGLIETLQVSRKMRLILTSPEEARKRAAERYAASGKPAEVKRHLAEIRPKAGAKRNQRHKAAEPKAEPAARRDQAADLEKRRGAGRSLRSIAMDAD